MDQRRNTEEITKNFELKNNENTTCQKLWNAAKPVLRGKCIAFIAYIMKGRGREGAKERSKSVTQVFVFGS